MPQAGWSYRGLAVQASLTEYWSAREASLLFTVDERTVRMMIAEAGLQPCGRRPQAGRGRSAVVYDADQLVTILAIAAAL